MVLTSTSTLSDALAQYNDNLSWEGSSAKAILELEAVRWLLINRPAAYSVGNRNISYSALEKIQEKLQAFVAGNTAGSGRSMFVRAKMIIE